jgi:uncharacterized membrane protein
VSADRRPDRRPERKPERKDRLDTPLESRRTLRALRTPTVDTDAFGRWSEIFARFMGTAWFIIGMTVFVAVWIGWNTLVPAGMQFDPRRLNYTLLTLILSLQASYAAPLILLAQNRQADRDRVQAEQDRDRAERALADTEYLAREMAALRIALGDVATRDFVRSELRALLDEASVVRKRKAAKPPRDPGPGQNGVQPERNGRNEQHGVQTGRHGQNGVQPRQNGSKPPAPPSSTADDPAGSTPRADLPTETG